MRSTYTILMLASLLFACGEKPSATSESREQHRDVGSGPVRLETVLQPSNAFVLSSIPVTVVERSELQPEIEALGRISYNTAAIGSISSRVAGRIEKLYVRYRYQKISKGQKIMDIYSPELMTAQQNLLFLLKNDPENAIMIGSARTRLEFLGMSQAQIGQIIRNGKPSLTVSVYSSYAGHIHETNAAAMEEEAKGMNDLSLLTEELTLKEGMYVQKGQSVFTLYDPAKAWAILHLYGDGQLTVKKGDAVRVVPETAPDKDFRASISFIEPFFQQNSKTVTARVSFDNSVLRIPIGSQVKATIFGSAKTTDWLPSSAVLSLGTDQVVFQKDGKGFRARKVLTGISFKNKIEILGGITGNDSVAVNAQFLSDSESFIRANQ